MIDQTNKNRTSRLGVRVTDEERRKLLEVARRCGLTVSEYLRRCALDQAPRLKRGVARTGFIDAYGDFLMQLRRPDERAGEHRQTGLRREIQILAERAGSILSVVLDDPQALE